VSRLIRGAKVLGLPIVATEQYPEGIGPTVEEIRSLLPDVPPLPKMTFSCCGNPDFVPRIGTRSQILLAGIETHVCVYQTCRDLLAAGYEVHVIADAVSSRSRESFDHALRRMRDRGATINTVEMALFELLGSAEGAEFRTILRIVK
jgi:hypothetical protein